MCGIAGAFAFKGAVLDAGSLESMIRQLGHRGPDDMSLLLDGGRAHASGNVTRTALQ